MKFVICLTITLSLSIAILVGCEKATQEKPVASESLPANLIATTQPAGAVDVVAAKKSAKDGESVVIKGRVGGQKEPLAASRAIMTIMDLSLPTCDKTPMDKCKTPWDACCEPPDQVSAKSVSVQVVGADGRPLKAGLSGVGGLAPLKQIVVAGTAKKTSGSDALIVEAKQIFVTP